MCLLFILLKLLLLILTIGVLEIKSQPHVHLAEPKKVYETVHLRQMNGYYYYSLSTPNYPHQFTTPYVRYYMINSTNLQGFRSEPKINIYLTELFVISKENIQFTDSKGLPWEIAISNRILSTTYSTLSLDISVRNLYRNHIRITEHFNNKLGFNNHFGFNISIEVVDSSLNDTDWSCSIRKCSFAGTCRSYPGPKRLEFRCLCSEGYFGKECQYGPECNPERNINFCLNGGKCRSFGYGGICFCPSGFSGKKCEIKPRKINFVSENQNCSIANPSVNDRPCSLCNNFTIHPGWNRYIIILKENAAQEEYEEVLENIFDGEFYNHSVTSLKNVPVFVIYGRLKEKSKPLPYWMSIVESNSSINVSNYRMQPEIMMNKEKERPLAQGQEFSLTCKINVPHNSTDSLIEVKWYKDNILIQPSYATSQRNIGQYESIQEDGQIFSVLMIGNSSPFDIGVFTCQATDLLRNVQECADYYMEVIIAPQIDVIPMSVTMVKNDSKLLSCSDSTEHKISGSHPIAITWFKDDREVIKNGNQYALEEIIPQGQGKLLRILNARESGTFICQAKNRGGVVERSVSLQLLGSRMNAYDSCPGEWKDYQQFRMTWEITAIGQTATNKCPLEFYGYAQRQCISGPNHQGKWDKTDFSTCTHRQLERFNFTLHSMQNGYGVTKDGLAIFHIELDNYLEMRGENFSGLLLGEGDKFINMWADSSYYLNALNSYRPYILGESDIMGLVAVMDKFIAFENSCIQQSSIIYLLNQFLKFTEVHDVQSYKGDSILIRTFSLSINDSESVLKQTNTTHSRLIFHYWPMDNGAMERNMTFIKMSNIRKLNQDEELVSDVIKVDISDWNYFDKYYMKGDTGYEIQFETNQTPHKNKTCAALNHSDWIHNSCNINISNLTVSCFCSRLGTFAVLAFTEEQPLEPKADKLVHKQENWIATSGCIVCLVLCFRSLVCTLIRKVFSPYFLLATGGIITSVLCLLFLILVSESRVIGIFYMISTLGIKSLRIWRMVCIYDMTEVFPWLEKVSQWILLLGILFTQILPLLTVFIFDTIFTNNEFLIYQDSPVFITFAILVSLSVLAIFFIYYQTYLRLHLKNNNCHGRQAALKENFSSTIIHLIQILSLVLYLNLKQIIFFHYTFAICNCILGLSWRSPEKSNKKSRSNITEDGSTATTNTGFLATTTTTRNQEMKPLGGDIRMSRRRTSTLDDDESDHVTLGTSVSLSVSTISHNGDLHHHHLRPYYGNLPGKGKCHIRLDDNYVLPSN